jgi:hypothetical protein
VFGIPLRIEAAGLCTERTMGPWDRAANTLLTCASYEAIRRYLEGTGRRPFVRGVDVSAHLAWLAEQRPTYTDPEGWHALVANSAGVVGVDDVRKLIESVTGIPEAEVFPDKDPEATAAAARRAAALLQVAPPRVALDPADQPTFDLPFNKAQLQAIVEAHVRSWLATLGPDLPTPVASFSVLKPFRGGAAARVRMFDGLPGTIYAYGRPNGKLRFRHYEAGFAFHSVRGEWVRAKPGQTQDEFEADQAQRLS